MQLVPPNNGPGLAVLTLIKRMVMDICGDKDVNRWEESIAEDCSVI